MLEVVITYKRDKAVWQVIDINKQCLVLKDNLKSAEEGHAWIKAEKAKKTA